jgi:hypothetical protein
VALIDSVNAIRETAASTPLPTVEMVHTMLNENLHRLDSHLRGTGHMEGMNQLFVEAEILRAALATHMVFMQDEIMNLANRIERAAKQ